MKTWMKNKLQAITWLGVVATTLSFGHAASATPVCQDLLAGQNILAGTVCVDNDSENLSVTYNTLNGWTLGDVHLQVATSLAGIPKTKNGSPIPGQFEFKADANGATTYSFSIPLGDYGVQACSDPAATLIIAAHAVVKKANGDGTYQSETAWGKGTRFVLKGNWATYFSYTVQCPPEPPKFGFCNGETAIAFGDNSFRDDYMLKRWGWENLLALGATKTVALLRGQTENVGGVTLSYSTSGRLKVEIAINDGHAMSELHIRAEDVSCQANSECVANGNFTVGSQFYKNIGQKDFNPAVNSHTFEYSFPEDFAKDGIYVVVHTVVGDTENCPVE